MFPNKRPIRPRVSTSRSKNKEDGDEANEEQDPARPFCVSSVQVPGYDGVVIIVWRAIGRPAGPLIPQPVDNKWYMDHGTHHMRTSSGARGGIHTSIMVEKHAGGEASSRSWACVVHAF